MRRTLRFAKWIVVCGVSQTTLPQTLLFRSKNCIRARMFRSRLEDRYLPPLAQGFPV